MFLKHQKGNDRIGNELDQVALAIFLSSHSDNDMQTNRHFLISFLGQGTLKRTVYGS